MSLVGRSRRYFDVATAFNLCLGIVRVAGHLDACRG